MTARLGTLARWCVGCLGLLVLLALFLLPVTPQFRFADQLRPVAEGIYGHTGPVDVLFVGTSRTMASIIGTELEALLEQRLGRPVTLYDLATSGRGADVDYLIVKETLKRSPVALVVAEYSALPQTGNHFYFTQAASWPDLVENAWSVDKSVTRFAAGAKLKLSMFMTQLTNAQLFWPPDDVSIAKTYDYSGARGPNEARIRQAVADGRRPQVRPQPGGRRNVVQDTYIRKIIDLVRSQGGEVVLMTMTGLNELPMRPSDRRRLSAFFGVDVIGLVEEDLSEFKPHHYADERHHGRLASALYLPLVAEWVGSRLDSHAPAPSAR